MTRLFPDVRPVAMGAMVMNISANMLGLGNAATPLGLKAIDNRLNKKMGTATDAMCTFLVINTSSIQLIPAAVIAIRAASGSANPTEIIGPGILATTVNTTVGIITVNCAAGLFLNGNWIETKNIYFKSEIRSTKSETNSNDQISKLKIFLFDGLAISFCKLHIFVIPHPGP